MSLVQDLGFGSECVRLYWSEEEGENGRKEITGGRYEYSKGTGAAVRIKLNHGKRYPRYVSLEEAADRGIEIDFEYQSEVYEEAIALMKEQKAAMDAYKNRGSIKNKGITIKKRFGAPAHQASEELIQSLEDKKRLEDENNALKAKLAELEASKESLVENTDAPVSTSPVEEGDAPAEKEVPAKTPRGRKKS